MGTDRHPQDGPKLELIALPPFIFAPPLIVGLLAHWLADVPRIAIEPASTAWILGALLIAAGVGLAIWAGSTFHALGENPHPHEPTSTIISDGPYAHSRNPIYLAFALIAAGIGVGLRSYAVLASVPFSLALIHFLVVRREEAYMDALFGEAYRAYKGRVRRYL